MRNLIIGIDPDIDKSGVATAIDGKISGLLNLNIMDLMERIDLCKSSIKCVYLEAAWLIKKSSWHAAPNKLSAERIAYKVGQNHQVGMVIEQFLKHHEIPYKLIRPTETKRNHDEFCILTKWPKEKRTNQELRDAGMLIVGIK